MAMPQDTLNEVDIDSNPMVIRWFDDLGSGNEDYNFLSNFYEGEPLVIPGLTWGRVHDIMAVPRNQNQSYLVEFPTGEHAYAALKSWGSTATGFLHIFRAQTPGQAKALGKECRLRADWEEVKYDVMAAVVRAKFTLERHEGRQLLRTGDALLVEGTFWGDEVWGVDLDSADNAIDCVGRNWLGTLLMARRAELRAEICFKQTTQANTSNIMFALGL